ncbi:MAG TPA: hypothetical protein PLL36_08410, partial [Candidatus Hydrogenedentes bacterium]|nr:hypothetical protein [Candidatus Hydrogenedentota bacterium]
LGPIIDVTGRRIRLVKLRFDSVRAGVAAGLGADQETPGTAGRLGIRTAAAAVEGPGPGKEEVPPKEKPPQEILRNFLWTSQIN